METVRDGIDESEVYYLILLFLSDRKCLEACRGLEQYFLEHKLLPTRTDFEGKEHVMTLEELMHEYRHLPRDYLFQLLLLGKQSREKQLGVQGLSLMNLPQQAHLTRKLNRKGVANRAMFGTTNLMGKLRGRECGNAISSSLLPTQAFVRQLRHQRTTRGHKHAVYCLTFDRASRMLITASDDSIIKLWSLETGQLLRSCLGHRKEVTDLSVSADNSMVASGSIDRQIRVWSLQASTLGHPVSVLRGHQDTVTFLDFHPVLANVLLSASLDGTCRLWDASEDQEAKFTLQARGGIGKFGPMAGVTRGGGFGNPLRQSVTEPSPNRTAVAGSTTTASGSHSDGEDEVVVTSSAPDDVPGLLCCSFSPNGDYIVAGGNDCKTYVWHWETMNSKKSKSGSQPVYFGNHGDAAGPSTSGLPPRYPSSIFLDMDGGQQGQRLPLGVGKCDRHPSFNTASPRELVRLEGHTNHICLAQFNHEGRVLATASKDGTVMLWCQKKQRGKYLNQWVEAHALRCNLNEAEAKRPRPYRRNPHCQHAINQISWTMDDRKLLCTVEDCTLRVWCAHTGKQLYNLKGHTDKPHVLECHPTNTRLAMTAGYDGLVILWDIERGKQLKSFNTRDTLPGPQRWTDPLQVADGHFSSDGATFAVSDVCGQWHLFSTGPNDLVIRAPYDQFLASETHELQYDVNDYVFDLATQQAPHLNIDRDTLCDVTQRPYDDEVQAAFRSRRLQEVLPVPDFKGKPGLSFKLPDALLTNPPTIFGAYWQALERPNSNERDVQISVAKAVERHNKLLEALEKGEFVTKEDEEEEEKELGEEEEETAAADEPVVVAHRARMAGRSRAGGHRLLRTAQRQVIQDDEEGEVQVALVPNHLARASEDLEDSEVEVVEVEEVEEEEQEEVEEEEEEEEEEGDKRAGEMRLRPRRHRTPPLARTRFGRLLRPPQHADELSSPGARTRSTRSHAYSVAPPRRYSPPMELRSGRKRLRTAPMLDLMDSDEAASSDSGTSLEEEDEPLPKRRAALNHSIVGHRDRRREKTAKKRTQQSPAGKLKGQHDLQQGRELIAYSWLQARCPSYTCYVPQMGDEVVYIAEGHRHYVDGRNDINGKKLFHQLVETLQALRPAEPCRVEKLTYEITGKANERRTVVELELRCSDPASPLHDTRFKVTLPHPKEEAVDFVILDSRYKNSVYKRWKLGETCKIYYDSEDGEEAFAAKVVKDKLEGNDQQVFSNPYNCEGLWQRFEVEWVETEGEEAFVSAWEMYDPNMNEDKIRLEAPQLDPNQRGRAQGAIAATIAVKKFKLFRQAPEPTQAFKDAKGNSIYYNTMVAVPLSLEDIQERLEHNYYRSMESLKFDVGTIKDNAVTFNGDKSSVAHQAVKMESYFLALLEGNFPVPLPSSDEDEDGEAVDAEAGSLSEPEQCEAVEGCNDPSLDTLHNRSIKDDPSRRSSGLEATPPPDRPLRQSRRLAAAAAAEGVGGSGGGCGSRQQAPSEEHGRTMSGRFSRSASARLARAEQLKGASDREEEEGSVQKSPQMLRCSRSSGTRLKFSDNSPPPQTPWGTGRLRPSRHRTAHGVDDNDDSEIGEAGPSGTAGACATPVRCGVPADIIQEALRRSRYASGTTTLDSQEEPSGPSGSHCHVPQSSCDVSRGHRDHTSPGQGPIEEMDGQHSSPQGATDKSEKTEAAPVRTSGRLRVKLRRRS